MAERAGNHIAIVGILVLIAALGGLAFLVYRRFKSRTDRKSSERAPESDQDPEA